MSIAEHCNNNCAMLCQRLPEHQTWHLQIICTWRGLNVICSPLVPLLDTSHAALKKG